MALVKDINYYAVDPNFKLVSRWLADSLSGTQQLCDFFDYLLSKIKIKLERYGKLSVRYENYLRQGKTGGMVFAICTIKNH